MAKWAQQSHRVVVIDGCFLHCHGRILKNLFKEEQLAIFDARSFYGKYTNIMDNDEVPEPERRETAQVVLSHVLQAIEKGGLAVGNGKTNVCSTHCGSMDKRPVCCRS